MGIIDDSSNSDLSGGEDVEFTLHKWGDLSFDTTECENLGDEFNPLEYPDSPTDPSSEVRGTIDVVTVSLDSST